MHIYMHYVMYRNAFVWKTWHRHDLITSRISVHIRNFENLIKETCFSEICMCSNMSSTAMGTRTGCSICVIGTVLVSQRCMSDNVASGDPYCFTVQV